MVALPFHFIFALSGLTIFAGIYLPVSETMLKPQAQAHAQAEAKAKGLAFKPAGVPAPLASVDAMVVEAKRRWAARGMPGEVGFLQVNHVGDANSYVSIYRAGSDRVTLVGAGACTSRRRPASVIREEPPPTVVVEHQRLPDRPAPAALRALAAALVLRAGRPVGLRLHRHRLHLLRREAQARSTPSRASAARAGSMRWR